MTYSQIEITFNDDLELNDVVNFRTAFDGGLYISNKEKWVTQRLAPNQVTKGIDSIIPGERSAINFTSSFNLDYNPRRQLFEVDRNDNIVTIKSKNPIITFDFLLITDTNPDDVDFEITNYDGSYFYIDSLNFLQSTSNPSCTHYKVSVTTSELATNIISPITVSENTDNPFTFELLRGVGFNLICEDADSQLANMNYNANQVPQFLNSSNFQIQITNTPNGATVSIIQNIAFSYNLEYSLDNSTWQTSNIFPGLLTDDYTLYIRDPYGCSINLDFTVSENGIVEPFFYISKSNSIRFVDRVVHSNCGPYKNDENTLSGEAYAIDPNLAYCENQLFKSCFNPITQFLSNYRNISAVAKKTDGTQDVLTVNKITYNIGRKDSRDAISYDLGSGKTGIYFLSGNMYDYDTNADTSEDYSLNGGLPEFAKIGNFISIGSAWFEITNIVFDESKNAEVLVIDSVYVGGSTTAIIVKSYYNRQNYEVYEFTTNMNSYNNSVFQIEITNQDSAFGTRTLLSEKIDVKDSHHNTIDIEYWNKNNDDMFYSTGIKNKICVPLISKGNAPEEDSETNKGDNSANLISSNFYEVKEFGIGPVTAEIQIKVLKALSHKYVLIDGVYYVKNGAIESEGPLEESNLYLIKAKMLKSNNKEKSQIIGITPELSDGNVEVPHLVITGDGEFISYD